MGLAGPDEAKKKESERERLSAAKCLALVKFSWLRPSELLLCLGGNQRRGSKLERAKSGLLGQVHIVS